MSLASTFTVTQPSDTEVQLTREFDAPARLVWDAYTKPEYVRQWLLGPDGWDMPVCDIDLRVGGTYRYEWSSPGQPSFGTGGTFLELEPPSRLVSTEKMDGFGGELVGTLTFVEHEGRTTLTMIMRFESKEARDMAVATGMAGGIATSYDRLERIIGTFE